MKSILTAAALALLFSACSSSVETAGTDQVADASSLQFGSRAETRNRLSSNKWPQPKAIGAPVSDANK